MNLKTKFHPSWNCPVAMLMLIAIFAIASCNSESAKHPEAATGGSDTSNQINKVQKVFYSIPSPLQATSLLKKAGAQYSKEILNPASNVSRYTTKFSQAINIGVYGTDLAYTNLFNQTQICIDYINAINKLAGGIGMASVLENTEISARFQSNLGNQDSLVVIISDLFRESDDFLKENQQFNSASLVIAGGWIEGLYIATNQIKKKPNPEISNRIAEQKFSLKNLTALLSAYKDEKEFADLIADMNGINQVFDKITIDRNVKEPTTDPKTKVTTLNTVSQIKMTNEQLKEITQKVEALRNKITK